MGIQKYIWSRPEGYRRTLFAISLLLSLFLLQALTTELAIASTDLSHYDRNAQCINPAPSPPPLNSTPVSTQPIVAGNIVINEILPNPTTLWNCMANTDNSWVELYNTQDQPFDLYANHINLDTGDSSQVIYISPGSTIAPHGFFVFFLSLTNAQMVRLYTPQTIIDQVSIPSLGTDISYARIADGSNNWQITSTPTIDGPNIASSSEPTTTTIVATPTTRVTAPQRQTPTHRPVKQKKTGQSSTGQSTPTIQVTQGPLHLPATQISLVKTPQHTIARSLPSTTPSGTQNSLTTLLPKILLTALALTGFLLLLWIWKHYQQKKNS